MSLPTSLRAQKLMPSNPVPLAWLVGELCAEQGRRYAGRRAYRRGAAFLLERLDAAPERFDAAPSR